MKREVPIGGVDQDCHSGYDAGRDEESRPQAVLTPFSFDGCDHDPCFSPVSWKKTSSSDLSNGRSSLTPIPAAVSCLLISRLFPGSVFRWMAPFCLLTASGPNIRVSISWAASAG